MELQGNITINKARLTDSSHRQAYVQQEDLFYSQLTVRSVPSTCRAVVCAERQKEDPCCMLTNAP